MTNEIMTIGEQVKKQINLSSYLYAADYDADSALKAAEIIFEENNQFRQCTPESKHRAVLDMMVQGLNPLKKQCSFIPYGKELQLIREYPGSIMVAKREDRRIKDIRARVVREGELFEMEVENGLMVIRKHRPTIESWNNQIIAAYAVAVDDDEKVIDMDLMSWIDILNTWKQTNLKIKGEPVVKHDGTLNPISNHAKYPERMARKTVIHRLCRSIIKSSPNRQLQESAERSDEDIPREESFQKQIENNANRKLIDFPQAQAGAVVDAEFTSTPGEPMATKDHAKAIMALREAARIETDLNEDISGFVGRQIGRIRELTAAEAESYIEALRPDKEEPAAKPDWA